MKKIIFMAALVPALAIAQSKDTPPPPNFCTVKVCNKLERYTINPGSWIKDKMGETCSVQIIPKFDAVKGKVLNTESRWYQGSFNPTKKSVTRVKEVYQCQ